MASRSTRGDDVKRIVLVRHGQSTYNLNRRFSGWSDPDLTELGRWQAETVGPRLAAWTFDSVWSSDLKRARQTAALAWGDHRTDARLREIHFGDLEGLTWTELPESVRSGVHDFETFRAPGGESVADLRDRVVAFCDDLPTGNHLAFCHGGVVRVLLADLGVTEFVSNASVVELIWSPRSLVQIIPGPEPEDGTRG